MTAYTTDPDLIDRWLQVRKTYPTYAGAAEQLGIKKKSLERIVQQARQAGDKRIPTNLRNTQAPTYDGLELSATMETSARIPFTERHRAIRHTAGGSTAHPGSGARGPLDLAHLLGALGLDPRDGR